MRQQRHSCRKPSLLKENCARIVCSTWERRLSQQQGAPGRTSRVQRCAARGRLLTFGMGSIKKAGAAAAGYGDPDKNEQSAVLRAASGRCLRRKRRLRVAEQRTSTSTATGLKSSKKSSPGMAAAAWLDLQLVWGWAGSRPAGARGDRARCAAAVPHDASHYTLQLPPGAADAAQREPSVSDSLFARLQRCLGRGRARKGLPSWFRRGCCWAWPLEGVKCVC